MKRVMLIAAGLMLAGPCFAQTEEKPADPGFYRLDFALKEVEAGKVITSRNYTMGISPTAPLNSSSVRTGEKVPVPAGGSGQFTFLDVGVNIDCRLIKMSDSQMTVQVIADINNLASTTNPPVINQTKWNAGAVVPLRKPTVLFTADSASTKRQMQMELTITPAQ